MVNASMSLPLYADPRVSQPVSRSMRRLIAMPFGLFAVTALLIIVHQGRLVEMIYPVGAIVVAALLYRRSPAHHMSFVFWLFFLTPEVRRFADFVNGSFNPTSPIMVAPLAAVALCGCAVVTNFRLLGTRAMAPLVLVLMALCYAFLVGFVQVGFAGAMYALVMWLFPVLAGIRLTATWRDYPVYRRVLMKTFMWGGFVMGVYGIFQYVSPPPWDVFWLLQSKMTSEGEPVPFGMRICSTMNSSGPFAVAIMPVLLMSLSARGKMSVVTGVAGLIALLLTFSRSACGAGVVGLIYPIMMLDGKSRLRLIGGLLAFALLAAPAMMFDQVSDRLVQRISTLSDLSHDNSYQVRAAFYDTFLTTALTEIQGQGLGTTGLATKLSDSSAPAVGFDSGLMEVPLVLGWPGTLLYGLGIALLLWRGLKSGRRVSTDRFAISAVGVATAMLPLMYFANNLVSFQGMFFYIGVTIPVIAWRYEREMRRVRLRPRGGAPSGITPSRGKEVSCAY